MTKIEKIKKDMREGKLDRMVMDDLKTVGQLKKEKTDRTVSSNWNIVHRLGR